MSLLTSMYACGRHKTILCTKMNKLKVEALLIPELLPSASTQLTERETNNSVNGKAKLQQPWNVLRKYGLGVQEVTVNERKCFPESCWKREEGGVALSWRGDETEEAAAAGPAVTQHQLPTRSPGTVFKRVVVWSFFTTIPTSPFHELSGCWNVHRM